MGAVAAAAAALTGRAPTSDGGDDPDEARSARREAWRGIDQGSIMSVELLTATLVWFGIGWLVDQALGTMPWFMFAGALLGNWVGLYLLWLRGQRGDAPRAPDAADTTGARPTPADAEQRADR